MIDHAPLPWKQKKQQLDLGGIVIFSGSPVGNGHVRVCSIAAHIKQSKEQKQAVADFIVEACNNYARLKARCAWLERALERISYAKPDRLDHSLDITIIERAAKIARDALADEKETTNGHG